MLRLNLRVLDPSRQTMGGISKILDILDMMAVDHLDRICTLAGSFWSSPRREGVNVVTSA